MTRAQEPAELRPGLPLVELRRVHALWRDEAGDLCEFSPDGLRVNWKSISGISFTVVLWHDAAYLAAPHYSLRPVGKSWSDVEALAAKAAEVQ